MATMYPHYSVTMKKQILAWFSTPNKCLNEKLVIHAPDTDVPLNCTWTRDQYRLQAVHEDWCLKQGNIHKSWGNKRGIENKIWSRGYRPSFQGPSWFAWVYWLWHNQLYSWKRQSKPVKTMIKDQRHINFFFCDLWVFSRTDRGLQLIQTFVCDLYGRHDDDINTVRYKMYTAKHGHLNPKSIPPCADSLR